MKNVILFLCADYIYKALDVNTIFLQYFKVDLVAYFHHTDIVDLEWQSQLIFLVYPIMQ